MIIFTTMTTLVVGVFFFSQPQAAGGFYRRFVNAPSKVAEFALPFNYGTYIAGWEVPLIFVGATYLVDSILELNLETRKQRMLKLPFNPTVPVVCRVDPPHYFVYDLDGRRIWQSGMYNRRVNVFEDSLPHLDVVPLSRTSFATRTWNESGNELVLAKRSFGRVIRYPDILEKQVDGVFCTDGVLLMGQSRLYYLYYYRNQFVALDTIMRILYRGRTIDTVSVARTKSARMEGDGTLTLTSPKWIVNHNAAASDKWFVAHSNIRADNEDRDAFQKHAVLDFYRASDGGYQFSIYLPNDHNARLKEFRVWCDTLVALYERKLVVYRINRP